MSRTFKLFTMLFFICLAGSSSFSQTRSAQIDSLMRNLSERDQFSGSILVSESGNVIYQNGFGTADVKNNIPFKASTPCYLASLTKQFTAMAVMILAEQKKLAYTDRLSIYFPEFPAYADKVTIRHLLNHTSGVVDYVSLGLERPGLTNKDVLNALIKQDTLQFTPGEKFEYSNSGYILLALIVEKVSGMLYSTFLKKNIFLPVDMKNTLVFDESKPVIENRAIGYSRFGDEDDYNLLTQGEGGIYSTVEDLFKWDQSLYTEKLVKRSTLDGAFTPGKLNDGSATSYGFGWGIGKYVDDATSSHAGRYGGFNTYIKRFMNSHGAVIFLTNTGFRNMSAIGNAIIAVMHNKQYSLPKLSVAGAMYKIYGSFGIDSALSFYASLKSAADSSYDWGESELNELGYQLLGKDKTPDAIKILKLNADAFPDSWNVYDGLGDAYMKHGDKELAILNYRQSLKLNPENKNAGEMLEKLGAK